MDFVGPGFDYEVMDSYGGLRDVIVDGTSFSTPTIAAIATIVWDVYDDRGFDLYSAQYKGLVGQTLKMASEGSYCYLIGTCGPNGVYDYRAYTPTKNDLKYGFILELQYGMMDLVMESQMPMMLSGLLRIMTILILRCLLPVLVLLLVDGFIFRHLLLITLE